MNMNATSMTPRHIKIKDYAYDLPDERIAKYPVAERDTSKLLIYSSHGFQSKEGTISEDHFYNITDYLPSGEMMVFNNTKVIQARLRFYKDTGALIEVFCLEPFLPIDYAQNFASQGHCQWVCMIGNMKKWKEGTLSLPLSDGTSLTVERKGVHGNYHIIEFSWSNDMTFAELLDGQGELPIPPYLNRHTEESDKQTYQTVYSKIQGSVAAPTAGLHFTTDVLQKIDALNIDREEITLHVGAGTFKPVKSEEIEGHEMHSEYIVVSRHTIEKLIRHEGKAIAVGTTSVRTLESLYYIGCKLHNNLDLSEEELHVNQWEPYDTQFDLSTIKALQNILDYLDKNQLQALHTTTQIIIAPGYHYHIVRWMVTNFHQPQSTLLLLVSAFIGEDWHKVYDYALTHDFRFLSYGDSSLLMP